MNYRKHSLEVNAILNILKQLCSVLFPLLTIQYITRTLGAENLGKVNFSASVISYFALIAQMGISNYAIREGAKLRNEKVKFEKFSNEVFSINIIATAISYLLLLGGTLYCAPLKEYRLLLIIQSITIIFTTLGADWINNIFEDFFVITVRTIIVQIFSLVLMFLMIQDKSDYMIYALILVLTQCGAYGFNIFYIKKYVKLKFVFTKKIIKHMKPVLYLFSNNIAMTVYINSDSTMLGLMKGNTAVAIYYIATKIYTVIKNIINAIMIVTLPRFSDYVEHNKEQYNKLCESVLSILLTVLLPAVVGLFCCSPLIISVLAGEEFLNGVMALKILSFSLIFAVLGGFNSYCIIMPNRKEKILLKATSVAAVVNILLNLGFIQLWSFNGAALTTVIAEIIVTTITYLGTINYFNFKIPKKVWFSIFLGCCLIFMVCSVIQRLICNDIVALFMAVLISVMGYAILLWKMDNPIISFIIKRKNVE